MRGVVDRLFTCAGGQSLTPDQLDELAAEKRNSAASGGGPRPCKNVPKPGGPGHRSIEKHPGGYVNGTFWMTQSIESVHIAAATTSDIKHQTSVSGVAVH